LGQAGGSPERAGAKRLRRRRGPLRHGPFAVLSPLRRKRVFIPVALIVSPLIGSGIYLAHRRPATPGRGFPEFLQRRDRTQVKQVRFADGGVTLTRADGSSALTVPPPSFL